MIAVDTSALMAIVLSEPQSEALMGVIEQADELLISAGTVAEALIVAERRNVGPEVAELIVGFGFEVVSVTSATTHRIADAYRRWGKGVDLRKPVGSLKNRFSALTRRDLKGLCPGRSPWSY